MKYDDCGVAFVSTTDLCDLLYERPDLDLLRIHVTDPDKYNQAVSSLYAINLPLLKQYNMNGMSAADFHSFNQAHWHMPDEYRSLDIAEWILDQCSTDAELQRCGEELLLYQERDAFDLLRYMKYLVDTMRAQKVLWGVGRGSSVASFVLYKIGVHRINSMYYDLDPREFLK